MDLDQEIAQFVLAHRGEPATLVFRAVTEIGALHTVAPLALVLGALLLRLRSRAHALVLVSVVLAAELAADVLKVSFDRSRPPAGDALVHVTGHALPSGHTTQATAFYGVLALLAARLGASERVVLATRVWAVLAAVAVGASRVYLGVHWTTDVLAGWVLGAAIVFVAGRWALPSHAPDEVRSSPAGTPGEVPWPRTTSPT